MALKDLRDELMRCCRCSYCKWIPFDHVKSWRFSMGCPSIAYNKFQAYSASGRIAASLSLIEGRGTCTERVKDIAFKCLLCGSCDVSCKICRYNLNPLEIMRELRFKLVEDKQVLPQHTAVIEGLRKENNMLQQPRAERGQWAKGLQIKNIATEPAEVVLHAGCRLSYDAGLQKTARTAIKLLQKAGVDVGILGNHESCCGGRPRDMGYNEEFFKLAKNNIQVWGKAKVKTVVTACSDCYFTFNRLYPEMGSKFEVVHMVEYIDRLIKQGKLKFTHNLPIKVTYHDPCHLGRQGEPYVPWKGKEKKIYGQMIVYEPRRPRYNGAFGIYEAPRNILKAIPRLQLVEMERNREYAWCCGSGGGAREAYPEFSAWTANERIEEAKSTGAESIVTACGWCERNFIDSIKANHGSMKVFDILELVEKAI